MNDIVATLYRQESRRVFSTLVRLLGSFDLAEDALHDAFSAASEQWPALAAACALRCLPIASQYTGISGLTR